MGDLAVGASGDDYGGANRGAVHILRLNSDGTVKGRGKFGHAGAGPTTVELANGDFFGNSLANIGDVDGDGEVDLAVGAIGDDTGGNSRGAIHIVRQITQFTPTLMAKIAHQANGGPTLTDYDRFGASVAGLGDIDGDGVVDLAVGAFGDDTGGSYRGAVHILKLNRDGTARTTTKIASGLNGGPGLANNDRFGVSVASGGDLDGDGVSDLIVGANRKTSTAADQGAIHILRLGAGGTVKSSTLVENQSGGPVLAGGDYFGASVASLGDLDGDGVADLVVGANKDDTGGGSGADRGAVHILRLNGGTALRDFGDAPDTGAGTGAGNYQTTSADSGPTHGIVTGLLLGSRISGEFDATQNTRANGDDIGNRRRRRRCQPTGRFDVDGRFAAYDYAAGDEHDGNARHALRLDRLQQQRTVRHRERTRAGRGTRRHEQRLVHIDVPGRSLGVHGNDLRPIPAEHRCGRVEPDRSRAERRG